MTSKEAMVELFGIAKSTTKRISALKDGKSLSEPIENDLVKAEKCMGYENMMEVLRKFKKSQNE